MVGKLSYYIYIDIYRYILSLQWPCHFWMATGKERCLLFSFMSSDWQDLLKPPSSCYWPIYADFSNLSAWIFSYIRVAIFHCCTRRLEESFRVARCFTTSEHCFMYRFFFSSHANLWLLHHFKDLTSHKNHVATFVYRHFLLVTGTTWEDDSYCGWLIYLNDFKLLCAWVRIGIL